MYIHATEISSLQKLLRSETVASFDLEEDFQISTLCGSESPKDNCFIIASLVDDSNATVAPSNSLLLGEPKNAPLVDGVITVSNLVEKIHI